MRAVCIALRLRAYSNEFLTYSVECRTYSSVFLDVYRELVF